MSRSLTSNRSGRSLQLASCPSLVRCRGAGELAARSARSSYRKSCRCYIESNPNLAYCLPVAAALFPRYKLIHIVRDGRTYVPSAYSKSPTGDGITLFMSDTDRRRRLAATDFPDDPYRDRWAAMSRFERICWFWAKVDSMVSAESDGKPNALTVRYEDLFDGTRGYPGLEAILGFVGLNVAGYAERFARLMQRRSNETEQPLLPAWQDWTAEQKRQFRQIAGSHMTRAGYPL